MDNSSTLDIDNNSGWQLSQRMIINDNLSEYTQWMTIVFTSRDCFRKISEGKLRTISWHVLKPIFGIEWFPWLIVFTTFWKSPKVWREFQAETLLKFTWSDLPPEVRDECWPHLPRAIQLPAWGCGRSLFRIGLAVNEILKRMSRMSQLHL